MHSVEIFKTRRSVNFFDSNALISDAVLDELLELAAQAPSSFNLQPWNVIQVTNQKEKEALKDLAWGQEKVVEAPVVFIGLADKDGWQEGHTTVEKNWQEMLRAGSMQEEQRGWFLNAAKSLYGVDEQASLAFAAKNTGFFAMSLMYAATSLGLDSHPMDGFDRYGVAGAFNIPNNYWIPLLLCVGYRKKDLELHAAKWRKRKDDLLVSFK